MPGLATKYVTTPQETKEQNSQSQKENLLDQESCELNAISSYLVALCPECAVTIFGSIFGKNIEKPDSLLGNIETIKPTTYSKAPQAQEPHRISQQPIHNLLPRK